MKVNAMAAKVDAQKCTGCEVCVEACPLEAISIVDGVAVISDDCTECGLCINECLCEAISLPEN
jgi:electron transfer flavoprotein alpha subunit